MTPLESLYARAAGGMRLGLAPMQEAVAKLGHPERAYRTVHVAGTNGKGSVSAMLESIARASGLRTGLYTSPHLCRFAERIAIDGKPLTDAALDAALLPALAASPDLSFFEVATLAAFLAFREAEVDLAILEVGLGGRLDATNVIAAPAATAITRIALDHTAILGGTLAEIAREKAGIAKRGVPLVIGALTPDARAAIDAVARDVGAEVVDATTTPDDPEVPLALPGAHQRANARIARTVAGLLGFPESAVDLGLVMTRWPGRLETVSTKDGPYLLDAAHNPDGAIALAAHLDALVGSARPRAMVFGALADKAWREMLDLLAPKVAQRVYAEPEGRAPTPPAELSARHGGAIADDLDDALAKARALAGPGNVVLVTGSIYLVGAARAKLLGLRRDPPVAL